MSLEGRHIRLWVEFVECVCEKERERERELGLWSRFCFLLILIVIRRVRDFLVSFSSFYSKICTLNFFFFGRGREMKG